MPVKTTFEDNFVVNTVDDEETITSIDQYFSINFEKWKNKNVLWDLRQMDFKNIHASDIRRFVENKVDTVQVRKGLKTALLVESDLAFGMMRMLNLLAEEKVGIIFGVFKEHDEAVKWLESHS